MPPAAANLWLKPREQLACGHKAAPWQRQGSLDTGPTRSVGLQALPGEGIWQVSSAVPSVAQAWGSLAHCRPVLPGPATLSSPTRGHWEQPP